MPKLASVDWARAIPGVATLAVNLVAPIAAINALGSHPDPRIWGVLEVPLNLGVVDLQNQMAATFAALAVAIVSGFGYALSSEYSKRFKIFATVGAVLAFFVFLYVFLLGGLASVHLQAYVPPVVQRPIQLNMPPLTQLLTVVRGLLFVYGAVLTILVLTVENQTPDKVHDQ